MVVFLHQNTAFSAQFNCRPTWQSGKIKVSVKKCIILKVYKFISFLLQENFEKHQNTESAVFILKPTYSNSNNETFLLSID